MRLLSKRSRFRIWDRPLERPFPLALAACAGVAISLVAAAVVSDWERQKAEAAFDRLAETHVNAIRHSLGECIQELREVRGLFTASNLVERDEFCAFCARLPDNTRGLEVVGWAPRVPGEQRTEFERRTRAEGLADFEIRAPDESGHWNRAPERAEYFPLHYVVPADAGGDLLGHDLAADPAWAGLLDRARDTGQTVSTRAFHWEGLPDQPWVLMTFEPVYANGVLSDTVARRRENLEGFIAGVLHVATIVESGLAGVARAGVRTRIYDVSGPGVPVLVYGPPLPPESSPLPAPRLLSTGTIC